MAITDVYRFVGNANFGQNTYQVTMSFQSRLPGEPLPADLATLAQDIKEIYRASQHTSIAWTNYTVTQLWGPDMEIDRPACTRSGGLAFAGSFTGSLNGAVGISDPLPPQCAMVCTHVSGFAGRRKRGRTYCFGLSEGDQAGGTWTSNTLNQITTGWQTFYTKYNAAATTGSWYFGVWSERVASGCVPNPATGGHTNVDEPHPELAFTAVRSFTLRPTVYSQRRRTLGRGL